MRLVTYTVRGRTSVGVVEGGWILDISRGWVELLRQRGVVDAEGRAQAECPPDLVLLLARDGLGRAAEVAAWVREELGRDEEGAAA
ncbi:MAG: 5-oxopent-3-ene-1,2,5-tricarboxylate decarboxylase, partial [Thermomicrobium sp.]